MRRKVAGAAAVMAGTAALLALALAGPGRRAVGATVSEASPAVAGPPAAERPAASPNPADGSQPTARAEDSPGACPSGGLDWTDRVFSAVAVDTSDSYWLVQERGKVRNTAPAAVILGDGVARVGTTAPGGTEAPAVDLSLTPVGSLVLLPGQQEPFSAAVIVKSASRPADLGPGLSSATWKSPALLSGCPPPAGSTPGPGALVGARVA